MTELNVNNNVKAPWHLWVVGIVGFLWSAMGAMDYVMTKTRNAEYMSAFTPEQLEFFYGLPIFIVACWATAVWCCRCNIVAFKEKCGRWSVSGFPDCHVYHSDP